MNLRDHRVTTEQGIKVYDTDSNGVRSAVLSEDMTRKQNITLKKERVLFELKENRGLSPFRPQSEFGKTTNEANIKIMNVRFLYCVQR